MAVLMIGAHEREAIARAKEAAQKNIVPVREGVTEDTPLLRLKDRRGPIKPNRAQHVMIPVGYHAAFSIEEQPAGFCTHLSISVEGRPKKGAMPALEVVEAIAKEFGVPYPPDKGWTEEYEPGEYAVNLLSLISERQGGNA